MHFAQKFGLQSFGFGPMRRFLGGWVALVICQLPCVAFRSVHSDLEQECDHIATPTLGGS